MNAMKAGVFLLSCSVVMATGQASICEFFNWRAVSAKCREQIQRECDCPRATSSPSAGQPSFCQFFNWRTVFAECRKRMQRECDCPRATSSPSAAITSTPDLRDRQNNQSNAGQKRRPGRGWRKSGDRYYECFNREAGTYQQAKEYCASYGGRLAAEVLRDPDVASYIISRCFNAYSNTRRPWIGLDEIAREGDWIWSDGGAMNPATTEWGETEPNNWNDTDEDCGNIWTVSTNKLLLNDAPCDAALTYICEV